MCPPPRNTPHGIIRLLCLGHAFPSEEFTRKRCGCGIPTIFVDPDRLVRVAVEFHDCPLQLYPSKVEHVRIGFLGPLVSYPKQPRIGYGVHPLEAPFCGQIWLVPNLHIANPTLVMLNEGVHKVAPGLWLRGRRCASRRRSSKSWM